MFIIMEALASLTLAIGLFLGPILLLAQNYYISAISEFLASSLMCAFFYDTFFRAIQSGSSPGQFRGIMGTGLCYIFLLPMTFLMAHEIQITREPEILQFSLLVIFVPIMSQLGFIAFYSSCSAAMRVLLCISIVPWAGLVIFFNTHYFHFIHRDVAARMSITSWTDIIILGLGVIVQYCIYHNASDSFSLQEGTIISQAIVIFAHQSWKPLFCALWNYSWTKDSQLIEHLVDFQISKIELFSEVAVTSGMIVLCSIIFCKPFQNSFGFYALTIATMALFSYPVLFIAYEQDFVWWMYDYIKATSERRTLFLLWTLICVVSVITVTVTIKYQGLGKHKSQSPEEQDVRNDKQEVDRDLKSKTIWHDKYGYEANLRQRCSSAKIVTKKQQSCSKEDSGITTVTRKIFHIIAMSAFLPGIQYDVTILNCACSSAVVIFTFLECMRVLKVWPVGTILDDYLNMFRDKQDRGALILTPIYLLVGFSLPMWLHQEHTANVALFSGVLSLGIGDTAASFVGSKYGKRRWLYGSKTVEGSTASIISMVLAGALLHYSSISVTFHPVQLVMASVLTSLLEAFTTQIDNLVLPLFMYCLLLV